MKNKSKKETELETLMYFMPRACRKISITNADVAKYFEWSEQGKHKDDIKQSHFTDGFNALVAAKQWRGRHIHEMYEPGILDGTMPYIVILEGAPRSVVDFMKKEMFQGIDAEAIEKCHQELLMERESFLIYRFIFTNPLKWRVGNELVRRGLYWVQDEAKHWFWEWKFIIPSK